MVYIHQQRQGCIPDVDNLSKPIVDAFSGVIYEDDSQVIRRSASRHRVGLLFKRKTMATIGIYKTQFSKIFIIYFKLLLICKIEIKSSRF